MSLLDGYALEQTALVLGYGARKYAKHNWRNGIEVTRLLDAGMRHILASAAGHDLDEESQLDHLAHAMCCVMFALWMKKHRPDMDDRWHPPVASPVVDATYTVASEQQSAALTSESNSASVATPAAPLPLGDLSALLKRD